MKNLKALIVDDELNARCNLQMFLEEYCPDVEVATLADSAEQARECIAQHDPDLVFLDIKMPQEDGFSLLRSLPKRRFSVVFTTAHDEFAFKAFRESAVDYLEKPINIEELQAAVEKVKRFRNQEEMTGSLRIGHLQELLENAVHFKEIDKTTIPTRDGFAVVKSMDIVNLVASDCYTTIHLADGRKYISCKNIKVYEESLNPRIFFRTHKSHIINMLYHLKEFSRSEGNMAVMSNASMIPIARRKLNEFIKRAAAM